ncbi:MAG: AMP-binding protein, partial [Rhodospirillaceae bacterium]|nr:AMP-binding protein [Rhodospirillaceae bacterium]
MDVRELPNIVDMFFIQVENKGERPFLWDKVNDKYTPTTWREAAATVTSLARGLRAMGVKNGERVVIVSENRPEWGLAELAIIAAGGIAVPAYTTNTVDDHLHIVEDSEALGMIVSTAKLAERALSAAHLSEGTRFAITMEQVDIKQSLDVEVMTWDSAIKRGQNEHLNVIEEIKNIKRTDTACIIYTSGTGGTPKGVMLSHGALLHNCNGAQFVINDLGLENNVFLSFLPLSHSYEHIGGLHFPISIGAEIYYAEGIEALGKNMGEAHPTIMTAVPRLYESMHARIMRGIEQQGGLKEKLFRKTIELGTKLYHDPNSLSLGERALNALLDKLVRSKVKARFGGRLKALISGGAPLNPEIGIFFHALGVTILQGYGQTESAPLISANLPVKIKMHTVGPAVPDTEVRIAEDGEILARGELLMNGYWKNEEATNKAIINGWLHTGDIGVIDEDGYIQITDRKKDIIVNSGG